MNKTFGLIVSLILIVSGIVYFNSLSSPLDPVDVMDLSVKSTEERIQEKGQQFPGAIELAGIVDYINIDSENITLADYIGEKVILIDFWTYTCINCQRTLPYITSWDEKYRDDGLLIIGVHTPEFEFEKDYDNVVDATKRFNVEYPVVLDNNYKTWRAYENRYWPRKYLIDIDGFIVYDHIGEGAYEKTEKEIQKALLERKQVLELNQDINSDLTKVAGERSVARSPETYFGAFRNDNLGNGEKNSLGIFDLSPPTQVRPNELYLAGKWSIQREFAANVDENARIIFLYGAKNVFLVARSDSPVTMRVLRNGEPITDDAAGSDVVNGTVTIQEDRLYKLVEDDNYGEFLLELVPEDSGIQAFAFTFG